MPKRMIAPPDLRAASKAAGMSPAILSGDYVFVTGMTGSGPDGSMPEEAEAQFRAAFAKIAAILAEAGLTLDAVVEMTSYHVGLKAHFDLFDGVRKELFGAPYPAWTAVEVAGLRREGAIVEIRVIASLAG